MFLLLLILALLTLASVACITLALRPRNATPIWRAIAGIASSGTGTASAILYYSTAVYARLIGGFPFYDPALLRIYRYGALSALLGVLLAVLAKGRVRVGAISLSIFILLLWILVGEFIKAAVDNGRRAEELLSAHPELINARWMHAQ